MLAFDCLPEDALKDGPFGLIRRIPRNLIPADATKELGLSLIFHFYLIYAAVFWVFALMFAAIAA